MGSPALHKLPYILGAFPLDPPDGPTQHSGSEHPFVQARLTIGRIDDPFEAEAEQVAQRIVHLPTGPVNTHSPTAVPPAIQAARSNQQAGLSLDDPALESEILGLSGGQPLPAAEQSFFEAGLGYQLGDVRLHTGMQAERLAGALSAQAFTVGRDIVFGAGTYAPGTTTGRYLLAHELTHVIQQTGGSALASSEGEHAGESQASAGLTVQAKQIQRAPTEEEGVCPVCGKVGKGTCSGCGSPFVAIQRMPIDGNRAPDLTTPVVQRLSWDDMESFGQGLVNSAAEGLGNLAELGVDAFASLIRQIAPGLADLISKGPIGTLTELITDGIQGWLQSLLGNINLGGMIDQLTGSFSTVFAMVTGLVNGDPVACSTVAVTLNGLRELAQNFAENPVVQQAKELFGSIQGTFDQVRNLIMAPVIDTLLELGGSAFDGIRAFAETIAGWASQIRSALGAAWDWASEQLGLSGGSDQGGIFGWLKEQASTVWNTIVQTVEPVIGPLRTVGMVLLAFSPAGPIYLLIKYGPQLVQMADWVIKHSGDPDIVKKSHEEMGNTILPQILETVQGFGQTVSQVAGELASSALQLGQSVLSLLEAVSGVPLLSPAQSLIQMLSDSVQKLVAWAQETFSDVAKDIDALFTTLKQIVDPYIEVLTSIGMAIAMPGTIPVILAGWAWQKLPDCYKPPIIDFLLDICIIFLENAPDLPMLGQLWPLLKSGVVGFLQGLRGQDPATKIAISNRLAKIISGASPSFLFGFAKGLLQGIWEGLTDPFVLAYTLLTVLSNVVNWLEEALTPQTLERNGSPAGPATQSGTADASAPQPQSTPATGGADESLQERARAMAGELQPPTEQVTGGFLPAVEEFFTGGEGLTFEQLQQKLGEAWSGALEAMRGAGGLLADAVCEFFTKEGADQQIGEGVGWLAGTIAVEVVLGILTAGTITALKPLQGIAKLLTWTDGVLEGAFKALSTIGGIVLDGLKGLRRMFSEAAGGAIRTVLDALDEIGAKLIQFGEELLGKANDVARVSPGAADTVVRTADDAADAARVLPAEREVLEQTASKRGPELAPNELEAELDIVRRNQARPIADGDYIEEVALPNGHEWKRHKDDKWCRFSDETSLCTIANSNGKPPTEVERTSPPTKEADAVDGSTPATKADSGPSVTSAEKGDGATGAIEDAGAVAPILRDPAEVWEELIRTYPNTRVMGDVSGGLDQRREAFIAKCNDGWWYDVKTSVWHRVDTKPRVVHIFNKTDEPEYILEYLMDRVEKGSGKRSLPGYVTSLQKANIIKDEREVLDVLKDILKKDPKNLDEDSIRHTIKEYYYKDLLDNTTILDKDILGDYGEERLKELRHLRMLEVTKGMNSSDRGNFIEDWLYKVDGLEGKAHKHVRISKDELDLNENRVPDVIHGDTIIERKSISGPMSDHDRKQMSDYIKVINKKVAISENSETVIRKIEYTFPIPEGVEANLVILKTLLTENEGIFTFVVTNYKGQTKKISSIEDMQGMKAWMSKL